LLDGSRISTERENLRRLSTRRALLLETLRKGEAARDNLRSQLLSAPDGPKEKEFARVSALDADVRAELATVEASLAVQAGRLAPFNARKESDHQRLTQEIMLVRTVRAGLGDWAAAHSRLAAAALERKPLQVEDLVQTALEIQELVKTIRARNQE
jgi:hypothetical protein